jgi:peroxiredoxin
MTRLLRALPFMVAATLLPAEGAAARPARPPPSRPAAGALPAAPDLVLTTRAGPLRLSTLRGRVVFIDFWATWCPSCKAALAHLEDLRARLGDRDLVIVAVSVDEDRKAAERFAKQRKLSVRVAFDPEGKAAERFEVDEMPTAFVVDQQGRIRYAERGYTTARLRALDHKVEQLIRAGRNSP